MPMMDIGQSNNFIKFVGNRKIQSYVKIESNRRFEFVEEVILLRKS